MLFSLLLAFALDTVQSPAEVDFLRPFGVPPAKSGEITLTASAAPSTVYVLVLVAPELLDARGIAGMDATIADMIDYTNIAFANSTVALTLRATYIGRYDTPLVGRSVGAVHGELQVRSATFRDNLMADYGADMLVLLKQPIDSDTLCGLAELGTPDRLQDPAYVPGFVAALGDGPNGSFCGENGIFAHEAGHVLGADHERGNGTGAFEFSHAYSCAGQCTATHTAYAQQFFSTPLVQTFSGEPCGIDQSDSASSADNGTTIDLLRSSMADLRPSMTVLGTVAFELDRTSVAENGGQPSLAVRRGGDLGEAAEVRFAVAPLTADGSDVTVSEGAIFFSIGDAVANINLTIFDDARNEPDETFQVMLRNPLKLALDPLKNSIVVTITDNDAPPPPTNESGGGGGAGWVELMALLIGIAHGGIRSRRDRKPALIQESFSRQDV